MVILSHVPLFPAQHHPLLLTVGLPLRAEMAKRVSEKNNLVFAYLVTSDSTFGTGEGPSGNPA